MIHLLKYRKNKKWPLKDIISLEAILINLFYKLSNFFTYYQTFLHIIKLYFKATNTTATEGLKVFQLELLISFGTENLNFGFRNQAETMGIQLYILEWLPFTT